MKKQKEDIESALIKKAVGYLSKEIVEEFGTDGEDFKLLKRKVTYKDVPPDVSAIKILMDNTADITSLSDEELEAEKEKLLKLLSEKSIGEKIEKKNGKK